MTSSSNGKPCRHCGEYKNYGDYHNNKAMRDGKSSYCKPCASKRSQVWRDQNRDQAKDTELRSKYGISLEDHVALFSKQSGRCAICGLEEEDVPRGKLFVDHCHATGEVRGLLCHYCNTGLGYFMDNPSLLSRAVLYLKKEDETNVHSINLSM